MVAEPVGYPTQNPSVVGYPEPNKPNKPKPAVLSSGVSDHRVDTLARSSDDYLFLCLQDAQTRLETLVLCSQIRNDLVCNFV